MRYILISLLLTACGGPAFAPRAPIPDGGGEWAGEDAGASEGDGGGLDAGCTILTDCGGYANCNVDTGRCECPLDDPHFSICPNGSCINTAWTTCD